MISTLLKYSIITISIILILSSVFSQEINNDTTINNKFKNQSDKNKSTDIIPIIAIISLAITSIFVAYFSGHLARKTEFEKNIIQKRIELFTEFTKDYEPCIRTIRRDIANESIKHKNGIKTVDEKIVSEKTELQWPIISKIKTIKLILNANDRDKFDSLYISIKNLIINSYLSKETYLDEIDEKYNQIEKIFYKNLINVKFN